MAKYLIEVNYIGDGISGLLKEGGTKRRAAVDQLFESVGGKVEAYYFAFGERDVFIIGDLPDNVTATALALRVNSTGTALCKTTVLLTPQEVDEAVRKPGMYRPPGYDLDQAEAAWDYEGGHLSSDLSDNS
ncbi:uncharacterized protein with GYD domain [Paucimonas lemoignei]|uniref:Uncharacterized protein with GYD domain n=1 Tax=Paucimonas lemoignei TaxID=29443 RepID=A0A4R3HS52_PAULE|nr:GYD domain-containing protein [Paucimonas lemoignei]TCS35152.1 uncharacterized protein with GYD domain [Paucimonas lemoignei]